MFKKEEKHGIWPQGDDFSIAHKDEGVWQ